MRLLNTSTYQIVSVKHPSETHYAALSHVWGDGEQTFQDVQNIHIAARSSFPNAPADSDSHLLDFIRAQLSPKIRRCCDYARAHGYVYLWIDTCCIDKTSSAELSEAINSMFIWYSQAAICYVFLSDVEASGDPAARDSSFRRSMWFKRGWTLQELIIPPRSVFLSKEWRMIGTKTSLTDVIKDVTIIGADVLLHTRQLHTVSVAERMAWAAGRETTRVEDEAYCLMGIFGIRLSVIYGEGSQAFIRLQEEIMRRIPDQSLFLWGIKPDDLCIPPKPEEPWPSLTNVPMNSLRASKSAYLFASCPMDFFHSTGLSPIPLGTFSSILGLPEASRPPLHTPSSYGVRTTFPVCTLLCPNTGADSATEIQLAILPCQDAFGRIPALFLSAEVSSGQHLIGGFELHTSRQGRNLFRSPDAQVSYYPSKTYSQSTVARPGGRPVPAHYARSHTRIVLLDITALKQVTSPVLQDICIPHQRLSIVSGLAILRNFPKSAPGNRFQGFCNITLPCWTLEHLSALGFSTNVTIQDSEMVPIALRVTSLPIYRTARVRTRTVGNGSESLHHDLTLSHRTRGIVIVTVSICPASVWYNQPLHATVAWASGCDSQVHVDASQVGQQITVQRHSRIDHNSPSKEGEPDIEPAGPGPVRASCTGTHEHVESWTDARKRFEGPPGAPTVALHFATWDDHFEDPIASAVRHYALDIRVDFPTSTPTTPIVPQRGLLAPCASEPSEIGTEQATTADGEDVPPGAYNTSAPSNASSANARSSAFASTAVFADSAPDQSILSEGTREEESSRALLVKMSSQTKPGFTIRKIWRRVTGVGQPTGISTREAS